MAANAPWTHWLRVSSSGRFYRCSRWGKLLVVYHRRNPDGSWSVSIVRRQYLDLLPRGSEVPRA